MGLLHTTQYIGSDVQVTQEGSEVGGLAVWSTFNAPATSTTVHSDQWAAYQQVQSLPNVANYDTFNHSVKFVNSTTRVHIQNVESY